MQVMATPQSQPMRGGIEVMVTGECAAIGLTSARPFRFRSPRRGVVGEGVQPATAPRVVAQKLCLASQSTIAAAAAGAAHAVVCCADETVFTTGNNAFGQLGTGLDGERRSGFAPIDLRLPVVAVSCGSAHTIVATLHGEMYACGCNTSGQLGLGDLEDRAHFTRSHLSDCNVISVAAGDSHTLAVTKHGALYSFGNNCEGQLGISRLQDREHRTFCDRTDDLTSKATPVLIQFEPELAASRRPLAFEVLAMSCGSRHSAAIVRTWRADTKEVLSDRALFTWGSNTNGQLGQAQECKLHGTPRWVQIHAAQHREKLPDDFPDPPLKAQRDNPSSMLWYESSGSSDELTTGSRESETGSPTCRRVGQGMSQAFNNFNAANRRFEESISRKKAPSKVACGGEFTLVVTADGCLYACGACDKGQLGVAGMRDRFRPTLVSSLYGKLVTGIGCGREHAFAIVQGGREVYGWGRNSEGQVGLTASSHVELPSLLAGVHLCQDANASTASSVGKIDHDDLGSIQRYHAAAVAGDKFSLLGHLDLDGFPKQEGAKNLRYNIPGDVLVCVLGTAIPRFIPYVEGTPPFVFATQPKLPDGIFIERTNGQLRGTPIESPGPKLQRFTIMAHSKCCESVVSTYVLQLRFVEPKIEQTGSEPGNLTTIA